MAFKRKTTEICRRGHLMLAGNIYIRKDGRRQCRECMLLADKKYREARKLRLLEEALGGK